MTQAKIADDAVGSDELAGSLTVDINGGTIDGTAIGASSASTVVATQVDITAEGDIRLQDASGGQYVGFDAPSTVSSSLTWTLPAADGAANYLLKTDGSGALGWAAAGSGVYGAWLIKSASHTFTAGEQIIQTSSSATTMTLPASPSDGDTVVLSNAGSGTVTVGRNSSNIDSLAEDGTLNAGSSVQLVYAGSTIGWHSL